MKDLLYIPILSVVLFLFLTSPEVSNANWIQSEINSTTSTINTLNTLNTQETQHSKSDSLPEGVTQDWLKNLRDENGNRITGKNTNTSRVPEDPEGDAISERFFTGYAAGDQFGYSVSSAGDVNGDGFSDVIIGALFNNGSGIDAGRAYMFYGGISMNYVADVILSGEAAGDQFGVSVSSAGDVNGDGYSDVIVGANKNDAGGSDAGRAYIFFGGTNMNNTADVILTGAAAFDRFGKSVSSSGDVNGDGYSDVIVGAYYNDAAGTDAGRAYIYFGGSSMNNTADVIFTGEASNDRFGTSVSSAGDVNGDGFSDIIVGADGNDAGGNSAGRAYVYFGGNSMNNTADVIFTGAAAVYYFGTSVSSAGDANGDGYSDVVVGAVTGGKAYIYLGGNAMDNIADVIMTGEFNDDQFGISVSSAGDINGDGYSDILVGAYKNDAGGTEAGRSYVYFGGISMDNIADVNLTGKSANDHFGYSSASAGDVNGDGYSDLIVGADLNDAGGSNAGRVYIYDYFMKNEIISDLNIIGSANNDRLGYSVSSAGDVNGDGYSDLIVGSYGFSSLTGRAYIYFGGENMDNTADVILTGEGVSQTFGGSVSTAGDVNGDGYSDVIVGAQGYNVNVGRAYIYFGGSSMNNIADVTITGAAASYFGCSVSNAGDVNGDGYSDVVIGSFGYDGNTGKAYIFYGGTSMNNSADVTMLGQSPGDYFGYSVSDAGDMNMDGYSDIVIGAYGFSTNYGKTYVYLGGSTMDNSSDMVITGGTSGEYSGYSVSTAGDVNGDGYSDIIVGSYRYSADKGKASIYYGGAVLDENPDVIFTGEASNDRFGESVSNAGDINADGYSDVIIGASGYSSYTGRSYIYFGGASMDISADVTMTGDTSYISFGVSVSNAGDINGDGYLDVMIGGNGYDSYKGLVSVFKGSSISAKPILNYVRDIPNDQGGKVKLKWAKSSIEANGYNNITNYLIYRSTPPGVSGFEWEQIADITAVNFPFYYFTANTYTDSSTVSNGTTYFLIKARNGFTSETWNSNIMFGRSLDNISPPLVSPFTAMSSGSDVLLNWKRSTAPDILNYVLFRSANPSIDPYSESPWTTATDSTLLDTSPLAGSYYYFIVAQDIHGNYSPVAVTESPNTGLNLDLTMFIEGFYSQSLNLQVSDTVSVELREQISPFAVVDQRKVVVGSDGTVNVSFGNTPTNNYYISIKHRNSIETWSSSPIALTLGGSNSYDLSSASSQAFGNNMPQVDTSPVRYGIYSGDENQNGIVDLSDAVNVSNAASSFTTGYVSSDMNGDNVVDLTDLVITSNNASAFVAKIVP
ncbi:MAG: FG-GAP repeat protein [Ignavibacteriae bacterium]|nr:FG-GAP repeat protein [Ignavibacteriota bacterium]